MPTDSIIPEKVGARELREIFNNPAFQADLLRRTCQTVETYCEPAPASANQVTGAVSHIFDWYEYFPDTDSTRLLAVVHYYKNPDGTIGASGKVDPQILVIGNRILTDP